MEKIVIPRAEFLCSAGTAAEFPETGRREICIMGRSNVGKSSFINHALADGSLAFVSKKPGKTVCTNFFRLSDGVYWVDMPGYGFAQRSRPEMRRISGLIGGYCERRPQFAGIIWLLDSRHPGAAADLELFDWITGLGKPILPVLTKCDKLSRARLAEQLRQFAALLRFDSPYVPFSVQGEKFRDDFWRAYMKWLSAAAGSDA